MEEDPHLSRGGQNLPVSSQRSPLQVSLGNQGFCGSSDLYEPEVKLLSLAPHLGATAACGEEADPRKIWIG